ncbi:MAG: CvpA family protein [Clostridia bacterium]|nr:CvpA family protein [Clostridia bacterium]
MIQIIDIVLLVLFAAILFKNWYTGFLKSVLSVVRLVLTIAVCALFGRSVGAWLEEKYIHSIVYEKVNATLSNLGAQASDSVQQFLTRAKENYGILAEEDPVRSDVARQTVDSLVDTYSESISRSISGVMSAVAGYVLVFLITFILLSIAMWILCKIVELPILRRFDKTLGLALGAVIGLLVVCLVSTIAYGFYYATGDLTVYESSFLFRGLYNLHLFEYIYSLVF